MDLRVIFKGNDEHDYLYVIGNDGLGGKYKGGRRTCDDDEVYSTSRRDGNVEVYEVTL